MSLPYIQVGRELLDHLAKDLSILLKSSEAEAGWMILKMWSYGLSRAREAAPDGIIPGAMATSLLEAHVGWSGDHGAFVAASESLDLLEKLDSSIRIKGMERYRRVWEKKKRPGPSLRLAKKSGSNPPDEVQKNDESSGESPAPTCRTLPSTSPSKEVGVSFNGGVGGFELSEPATPPEEWTQDEFWLWAQSKRKAVGLPPERWPNPHKLRDWWREAKTHVRATETLQEAFLSFSDDPYWSARKYPWAGFQAQWAKYCDGEVSHVAS